MRNLTSGSTLKLIRTNFRIPPSLVNHQIANCLQATEDPPEKFFPKNEAAIRGEIKQLSKIVRVTIAMTNWSICHHPLRQLDKEMIDENNSDRGAPAIELDESSSDSD
jgi:hypothetical protein